MGRAKGLKVASTIGLCIAVFVIVLLVASGAAFRGNIMLFFIALFVAWQAWQGRRAAELMMKAEDGSWEKVQELARRLANERRREPH